MCIKFFSTLKRGFAFCFFFCSLFSPAAYSQSAYSQPFSSIDSDLTALESLIQDTISSMEEQQKLLDGLRESLNESGSLLANYESIIQGQENLLKELQARLNEMSETYRMQSQLSAKYAKSSKFWKTFTLIAIPATALISGGLVWAASR